MMGKHYAAPQSTPSSLTQGGLLPKVLPDEGLYRVLLCGLCGTKYQLPLAKWNRARANNTQIGLACSRSCGRKRYHLLNPGVSYFCRMKPEHRGGPTKAKTDEHRAKLSAVAKAKGHRPPIQGGNGKGMTHAETLIASVLPAGWVWNYPVALGKRQQGFPTNYKLDFAWPERLIGLEVDGHSHTALHRKQQDQKKEAKLAELGWKVFRISNAQAEKLYTTSKLKEHLTTLLGMVG